MRSPCPPHAVQNLSEGIENRWFRANNSPRIPRKFPENSALFFTSFHSQATKNQQLTESPSAKKRKKFAHPVKILYFCTP